MAEMSYLWNNPGVGDSPAAPGYTSDVFNGVIFRMLLNGTGNRGVLPDWLNELAVGNGGGLNASVATGGAIVAGRYFENTTATTVALPPSSTVWVVARALWGATQTIRLAQVPAVLHNFGATYDVPLAEVTTGVATITLITDAREWVEYSTDLHDDVVESVHVQANAATTAKMEDHTRHVWHSAGMLEPDATTPAAWVSAGSPMRNYWRFVDGGTTIAWLTFRVPADISSATVAVYFWNRPESTGVGTVQWGWSAQVAAASAALVPQAGTQDVDNTGRDKDILYRDAITTLTVSAGDLVHMEIMRNGGVGADTETSDMALGCVETSFTADW
jgi:hypothetical protein